MLDFRPQSCLLDKRNLHVPRLRGKNTTLMASLYLEGIGACMIIEGAVNSAAFEANIEHYLVPSLQQE